MKRIVVVVLLLLTSCSHKTVHLATGSSSPSPTTASTPQITYPAPSKQSPSTTASPRAITPPPNGTYTTGNGIDGKVVAGPTCPVERQGHPCPPHPVTDATITAQSQSTTKTTHTDSSGNFTLTLDPGAYEVSASSKSVFGCQSQHVDVAAHKYTHLTITCDTGIR